MQSFSSQCSVSVCLILSLCLCVSLSHVSCCLIVANELGPTLIYTRYNDSLNPCHGLRRVVNQVCCVSAQVENFSVAFSDGRVLCYPHPPLSPRPPAWGGCQSGHHADRGVLAEGPPGAQLLSQRLRRVLWLAAAGSERYVCAVSVCVYAICVESRNEPWYFTP